MKEKSLAQEKSLVQEMENDVEKMRARRRGEDSRGDGKIKEEVFHSFLLVFCDGHQPIQKFLLQGYILIETRN